MEPEALEEPEVVEGPEAVVEGSDPEPDEPEVTNAATGGPGNVYDAPGLKTSGTKIPGSLSLYAPGKLTSSLACGPPVWEPPTFSWAQDG